MHSSREGTRKLLKIDVEGAEYRSINAALDDKVMD